MTAGIPLNDSDRSPWLAALHNQLLSTLQADRHPVLACSALKERYRFQLLEGLRGIEIIYLKGSYDLILTRMSRRAGHYMKPEMLRSQFKVLEEPADAFVLDAFLPLNDMIEKIVTEYFS